jgi:transcriptional regulator with XRE-family HTH domain
MPSFRIGLEPKRRAAARFVVSVRRSLQKAFADEKRASGLSQTELADRLGVHRSEITRELRGQRAIGVDRVAELAWAMGFEPHFELKKPVPRAGQNINNRQQLGGDISKEIAPVNSESTSNINDLLTQRVRVPV